MELLRAMDTNDAADVNETLMLFGGAALLVMDTGMILSSTLVRRQMGSMNVMKLLEAAVPDVERYLKLKAM